MATHSDTNFEMEFGTDNAAFDDGDGPAEVARILREIADKVEAGRTDGRVLDINGNTIGSWGFDLPPQECGQCEGRGRTDAMGEEEECPVCDGEGTI